MIYLLAMAQRSAIALATILLINASLTEHAIFADLSQETQKVVI